MASGASMLAAVRKELGSFDDATTFQDSRIVDYLNEGQALYLPDVTVTTSTLLPVTATELERAFPQRFVRVVQVLPDPNFAGTHRMPPYELTDSSFIWLDRIPRDASQVLLIYEAAYAPIVNDANAIALPDPGPEGLVAFAAMRCLQRLIGDRAAYRRYATQTGTNVVQPEDMERLAEVWHTRYLQTREALAIRIHHASMEQVAQF